jgi:HD-GYP domain-containing protein (c-di-GMP phosphodiesterase class II)
MSLFERGAIFIPLACGALIAVQQLGFRAGRRLDAKTAGSRQSALHDVLAGLPDQGALTQQLESWLADLAPGEQFTLVLLDLDRLAADLLIAALAARDPDLGVHACDVATVAVLAAQRLGLDKSCIRQVGLAAELHDLGKLAIPDRILEKPGPLDEDEWEIMRTHTDIGARILAAIPSLAPVATLVRASHERHDGTGYPSRLAGEQIPVGARIIAACDAYDAMTSKRVYSEPIPASEALQRLRAAAGSQFDPDVVDVVCDVIERLLASPESASSEQHDGASATAARIILPSSSPRLDRRGVGVTAIGS